MSLPIILGWKHNHVSGICCREDENGVMRCTEFPGGIPTQAQIDTWTTEYAAYIASGAKDNEDAVSNIDQDKMKKMLFTVNFDQENRLLALEKKPVLTKEQYRAQLVEVYKKA